MKIKERKELRELGVEELQSKLEEARKNLFELRFRKVVGSVENKNMHRVARRNIARILTLLTEKDREVKVVQNERA